MQTLNKPPTNDLVLQYVDTIKEPPPPPTEIEPEEEPEPEEKPPELIEKTQKLDLSQLELALNLNLNTGWMSGDFAVKLDTFDSEDGKDNLDELFSMADLDQKPRVVYQPGPIIGEKVRRKSPGTVYILFIVDEKGNVENPVIQSSTDPVFEKPAITAVKQWKFEPGKRKGKPVRFRMRVPITFPKGGNS
jgi:protein TonB